MLLHEQPRRDVLNPNPHSQLSLRRLTVTIIGSAIVPSPLSWLSTKDALTVKSSLGANNADVLSHLYLGVRLFPSDK